jgi:hypothetical protein
VRGQLRCIQATRCSDLIPRGPVLPCPPMQSETERPLKIQSKSCRYGSCSSGWGPPMARGDVGSGPGSNAITD